MSSDRAIQLHSLVLNDQIDTWDDWKIVSVKRPVFFEPDLRSEYAEVPGRDGSLDMTEVLTGYPLYENRTGTLQFFLYDDSVKALTKLNTIRNYLHGKKHKIVLSDEPEYYYIGRLMMHESHPTTEGEYAVFDLEYNLEPYKYDQASTAGDWLWDPFNFETGVIREYGNLAVDGSLELTVVGSRKPTVPKFTVAGGALTLTIGTDEYELPIGVTVLPQIVLMDEEYTFEFTGTGTVSVEFRGGSL